MQLSFKAINFIVMTQLTLGYWYIMTEQAQNIRNTYASLFLNTNWHSKIIGMLVGLILLTIYLWILAGIASLVYHLYKIIIVQKWSHGAEIMIKDVVIMLASLELIRTLQSYLKLGRVKVTFILDAALVVLIGELISLWYQNYNWTEVFISISVIAVLIILRIITSKFSPDGADQRDDT